MIKIRRKIQKISGSYYLNLPKEWINNRKINVNQELEIAILEDGTLRIAPEIGFSPKFENEKIVLPPEKYVARQIIRKCLTGAKTIIVQSKDEISSEIKEEIYKFVKKLPTAEIIDEEKERIEIRNFKYTSVPAKQAIKRMYQLTRNIFTQLLEGEYEKIGEYIKDINRFFIVVVIHIRSYLTHDIYSGSKIDHEFLPIDALDLRMLADNIQRISSIINLNLTWLEGAPLNPKIKSFAELIKKMFEKAMKSYFENDSIKACETWETYYQLVEKANSLLNELKDEKSHLIIYNFLRIADYSRRISDLVP